MAVVVVGGVMVAVEVVGVMTVVVVMVCLCLVCCGGGEHALPSLHQLTCRRLGDERPLCSRDRGRPALYIPVGFKHFLAGSHFLFVARGEIVDAESLLTGQRESQGEGQ